MNGWNPWKKRNTAPSRKGHSFKRKEQTENLLFFDTVSHVFSETAEVKAVPKSFRNPLRTRNHLLRAKYSSRKMPRSTISTRFPVVGGRKNFLRVPS